MRNVYRSLLALSLNFCYGWLAAQPIALHPENPHYFLYRGKPAVLITSGEHYGSVLNLDFDYVRYLDALRADGLNLTRTFTGAYVEPAGAFNIAQNTMAPAANRFICPWARSKEPGYANGGNKFDLTQWDDAYFQRLKDFMSQAEQRGIVVELALFCPFYEDIQWNISPLNAANNVNGLGTVARTDVYTLDKNGGLLAVQEAMVRKLVQELKGYSNLMYEICNEPYFGGVTIAWQHHMADIITEAENGFPARHLITQNIANGFAKIEHPHPAISVFNFHYATPPHTVPMNYALNKVLGDNETGFKGNADSTYRREGWEFILSGGSLYNNLDYSFTADHEDGTFAYPATQPGGGSVTLRRQLHFLADFMARFDFIRMKPDSSFTLSNTTGKTRVKALAEPGRQYAVYWFGGGQTSLETELPKGNYAVEWLDPSTGQKSQRVKRRHGGGKITLRAPAYPEDAALRLVRIP